MNASIKSQLLRIVGADGIVGENEAADRYLIDHRQLFHGAAAAIVKPRSTAQVAAIVKLCADTGTGVVPQGGNTGYCGGATPDTTGSQVVICLERLNRIRDVDAANYAITTDAGVILADVQRAAAEQAMLFPLSLGAEGSCQIGGNLSTNAGGTAVVRYGNARDLVLGLEVVLPNGDILDCLNKLRKDNTGYDIKQLFLGAEGTLGIITGAVLKTFPQPVQQQTALLAFPDVDAVCRGLNTFRRETGDMVTSYEYMSKLSLDLVFSCSDRTFPMGADYAHYALIELTTSSDVVALEQIMASIVTGEMEAGNVLDGVIAQSEQQRQQLWWMREAIPETERRLGGSIKHDISIPISAIPEFLARIPAALNTVNPGHRISVYGHIGDGNLHLNLLHPVDADPARFKRSPGADLSAEVFARVHDHAGSFSAEHGVGQLKKLLLQTYKDPAAVALMRRLKNKLDPKGIMNPGKIL